MPTGKSSEIYNLPNLVSFIRLLMAPVLLMLAIRQQPTWFLLALLFTEFTDVLDGFLARRLNQITELGSHLDSWGDFVIYSTITVCAWLLWPDIVREQIVWISIIVISLVAPVIVGLIKLHALTSYHTWSVKIAVALTILAYFLVFSGLLDWPLKIAAFASAYASLEEILITLLIRHEQSDVRSFVQALKYHRQNNGR
ncbi:MAG TPA: CDP-alcohol phosphatidyltransferase family protein [Gammaproteobacteria bacterium]|nr:CDP-alcohol phosphatidyltransferase family protein [Gammaproteobacteria bacterium]